MKNIKGQLFSGDFKDNTMTFEIDGDFILKHGNYIIVREEDYAEMHEALKEAKLQIEYMQEKFKPTGTGNLVLSKLRSLLKEIES